ncbi:MAG: biotin--[acetyl-CoA-carboxylase] ligase [Clostridium sp.]|uniref:biotin--[acetyl-CoA-carboxylase] ligase n=1 Tax=Clostridium sp. TaxID=1506 RepID=UPI00303C4982
MKKKILNILRNSEEEYISGERISEEVGITRAGIWKHIKSLKELGYEIDSVSNKGYKLSGSPDIITYEEIEGELRTKYVGRSFIHHDTVDSTNIQCRKECGKNLVEGLVIVAEEQTSGKGRLGRNWVSPKSTGIWMSVALTPDISPILAPRTTLIGAAAVYEALKDMGFNPGIKWPNDIVIDGKKVCGILTEMNAEIERVNYIVMGIGINVNTEEFPEELLEKATSLRKYAGCKVDRKLLVAKILNNIEKFYEEFKSNGNIESVIDICRKGSILLSKEVRVINGPNETLCRAIDIDEDGELIVEHTDGTIHKVLSGEVSVRGIYGYV